MDERTRKWVLRILCAIGLVLRIASWILIALSLLAIVNGDRWVMLFGIIAGVLGIFASDAWMEECERQIKEL